ncbi:hypothetical protein FRUB_02671 [Fimbriiglobus ruber]|uniref:Uncharacterized protein n=1 Tax=Fimbriiglobus ruber TaxID=1908690 RepID=A0A225DNU1_9BACT|nr:hypothetical protein FRUB_02671 [Fimbriiglobus ruber]
MPGPSGFSSGTAAGGATGTGHAGCRSARVLQIMGIPLSRLKGYQRGRTTSNAESI